MSEPFEALKKSIEEMGGDAEFYGNSRPKCPHCGKDYDTSDGGRLFQDGEHEITCGSCNRLFTVETDVTIAFHTCDQDGV